MSVKERIRMSRLLEKAARHAEYAKRLGVETALCKSTAQRKEAGGM